jgi:importin-5
LASELHVSASSCIAGTCLMLVSCTLQVTQIMVPLLKFYFHEDVRIAAVQCMPELLRSATLAVEKGTSPDASMPAQMLDFFWQPLLDAMHKVKSASILLNVACSLVEHVLIE